jgi:hypothetical protein
MNNLPKYSITYTVRGGTITFPSGGPDITFSMPLAEYERIDIVVENMVEFPEVVNLINKLCQK